MALVTTSQIQSLLRPGLKQVFGDYGTYPDEWKQIFAQYKSDKAVEYETEMQPTSVAQMKNEGTSTFFDIMKQVFISTYYHQYFSIGVIFTRQAIVDNLYKDRFPMAATSMKSSLRQAKNIQGANVLNNGFNASYPGSDGQPLFSTTHPLAYSNGSNTFTIATQLSESAIQDAWTSIQAFTNVAGIRVPTRMVKLIVPPALQWTADILLGSKYRTATANNDINPVTNIDGGLFSEGYIVNHYLTSASNWYVKTDNPDGLKQMQRESVFFLMNTDADTQNLKISATERYSFGWSNWRGAFGSQGM